MSDAPDYDSYLSSQVQHKIIDLERHIAQLEREIVRLNKLELDVERLHQQVDLQKGVIHHVVELLKEMRAAVTG